ncbi:MAG: hypothetical protein ACE5IW_06695 [bacterium]
MKRITITIVLLCVLTLIFEESQARGAPGKLGFGVSVQPSIVLTGRYWFASDFAVDARFGLRTNGQDILIIGGSLLKTFRSGNKVYPYFGGKIDITNIDNPFGDDTTVSLGAILGGEYFVIDRFSVMGESQLQVDFDGGTSVGTQVTLSVLFYLN